MFCPSCSLILFGSNGITVLVVDGATGVAGLSRECSYDLVQSLHVSLARSTFCFLSQFLYEASLVFSCTSFHLSIHRQVASVLAVLASVLCFVSG